MSEFSKNDNVIFSIGYDALVTCCKFSKSIVMCLYAAINPTLLPMGEINIRQINIEYWLVIRLKILDKVVFAITHQDATCQSFEMHSVFTGVLVVRSSSIQRSTQWFPIGGYTTWRIKLADMRKSFTNDVFIRTLKGVPTRWAFSLYNHPTDSSGGNESPLRILQIQHPR